MMSDYSEQEFDWGTGWLPVRAGDSFQRELDRELHPKHPLYRTRPTVFGRCIACDDVVASVPKADTAAELVVIYLTWSARSEDPNADGPTWPHFERITRESFVARFLRGLEHL